MIKFKAWNASNSTAIAKFHYMGIGHFGHNAFIHELIIGSLSVVQATHLQADLPRWHTGMLSENSTSPGLRFYLKAGSSCWESKFVHSR